MSREPMDLPEDEPTTPPSPGKWRRGVIVGGLVILLGCPLSATVTAGVNGLGGGDVLLLWSCGAVLAVPLAVWAVVTRGRV